MNALPSSCPPENRSQSTVPLMGVTVSPQLPASLPYPSLTTQGGNSAPIQTLPNQPLSPIGMNPRNPGHSNFHFPTAQNSTAQIHPYNPISFNHNFSISHNIPLQNLQAQIPRINFDPSQPAPNRYYQYHPNQFLVNYPESQTLYNLYAHHT